jgi:hypothetical protein
MFAQYHVTFTQWHFTGVQIPCELLTSDPSEVVQYVNSRVYMSDLLGVSINLYPVGKRLIDMCEWMDIPTRPSVEPQSITYEELNDLAISRFEVNHSIKCVIVN